MHQRTIPCKLLSACAATLALCSVSASHAVTTHYTERYVNSADYVNKSGDYNSATYGRQRDTTGGTLEYGWSGTQNWAFGNGSGGYVIRQEYSDVYALANLGTGELKARSVVGIGGNLPGSGANPAYGYTAHTASATASFADTFSFVNSGGSSSYLWNTGQQFQFQFAVDGQTSLAPGQAAPTDYTQAGQSYALVGLKIYRAGEGFSNLEAFNSHIDTMDWNNAADVAELYRLDNAIRSATLTSHYWLLGDSLLPPNWYTDPNTTLVTLGPNGEAMLDYSFAAGGDFEFVLDLQTQARIDGSYQNMTNRIDFSHTLAASFIAPQDATIVSASGYFPGTVAAVPEPQTYALMLVGLALVAGVARRRGQRP